MRRVIVCVIVYAICVGVTEGFAPGTLVSRTGISKKFLHMCAAKDAAHVGQGKKVLNKAAALLSALCIGTAVAPSASRARDLSPEALAALSAPSSSLVAQEVQEVPQQGKTTLKTINDYAVGAGTVATAGILGSVFIFRKGGISGKTEEASPKVKRPVAWDPATLGAPRAATGGGTQAPPPAKLTLPLAKLQALAVNEKQWLSPAASSTSSSSSSPEPQWPLKVSTETLIRVATGGGTQAPPPAKLTLPIAKLQALAVNEKQWLSPAASSPSSSPSGYLDGFLDKVVIQQSVSATADVAKAAAMAGRSYADAIAATSASASPSPQTSSVDYLSKLNELKVSRTATLERRMNLGV